MTPPQLMPSSVSMPYLTALRPNAGSTSFRFVICHCPICVTIYGSPQPCLARAGIDALVLVPCTSNQYLSLFQSDWPYLHVYCPHNAEFEIFASLCAQDFGRRIPFAFLEDVRERYLAKFDIAAQTAPAYAHNAEFSKILEERMDYYSSNEKADTINRVRGGISEVKNVMIENIDKVCYGDSSSCES